MPRADSSGDHGWGPYDAEKSGRCPAFASRKISKIARQDNVLMCLRGAHAGRDGGALHPPPTGGSALTAIAISGSQIFVANTDEEVGANAVVESSA